MYYDKASLRGKKAAKEKIQVPWNRNIGFNNKGKLVSDERHIKYFD